MSMGGNKKIPRLWRGIECFSGTLHEELYVRHIFVCLVLFFEKSICLSFFSGRICRPRCESKGECEGKIKKFWAPIFFHIIPSCMLDTLRRVLSFLYDVRFRGGFVLFLG